MSGSLTIGNPVGLTGTLGSEAAELSEEPPAKRLRLTASRMARMAENLFICSLLLCFLIPFSLPISRIVQRNGMNESSLSLNDSDLLPHALVVSWRESLHALEQLEEIAVILESTIECDFL